MKPEDVEAMRAMLRSGAPDCDVVARLRGILEPKPRTVKLPAADLPAPLEEVPERGWTLAPYHEHGAVVLTGAPAIEHALGHGLLWRTREDAEAWLDHLKSWKSPRPGDNWTPHTPGDPMPCAPDARVDVHLQGTREVTEYNVLASSWLWLKGQTLSITAWRYAREGEA